VTLLQNGEASELHFCEVHFAEYMNQSKKVEDENLESLLSTEAESQPQTEPEGDNVICPECGISFKEFRKQGRFGCSYDYVVFRKNLHKLLENIHNDTVHRGKLPKHSLGGGEKQYQLLQKKRELSRAIEDERYEAAAGLRDEIQKLEESSAQGERHPSVPPQPNTSRKLD
jgi:protein arginine kinase activator